MRGLVPWEGAELLAALGVTTAVVFVGRSVLILAQHNVQYRVAENAGARLSARLLDGYLAMPYEFHLQRNSSEMVRNAFDSVQRFVREGLIPGVKVVGKLAIVVGVVAVLVVSSPLATAFAVAALGPLTWGVRRLVHPRVGVVVFIVAFVWVAALAEGGVAGALPLLGLFGYAAARLMPELQQVTQGLNALKFVGPAVDDLHADLDAFDAEARIDPGSVEPLAFAEALVCDGVGYRYPATETDALAGVDLEIRPGESVGVVGPTGGGKSTLVDVLLGLLAPTAGQVTVDGVDLRANIALGVPAGEVDEAALDNDTEAALMDALEQLRGQRTLITVAHRLSTVEGCDTVLLVRDGRVADRGPFAELASRNPELQRAETLADPA